jgi:16S rRNA (adenine1518-N6/adenine1519-N6)-dimethyltransferase
MMQKEVAERVSSPLGRRARSTISVLTSLYYDSEIICGVPPDSFRPPPKVNSAVVRFARHNREYEIDDFVRFEKFVRFCFASKRKNLLNNLNSAYPIARDELEKIITETCGSPKIRAEQLDLDTFVTLSPKSVPSNLIWIHLSHFPALSSIKYKPSPSTNHLVLKT